MPIRGEQATAQSGPLHILVVEYDIVPVEIDKCLTAVKELGAASVKEPGFHQLFITRSRKDPNHVLLFELWDDTAAHAAHVKTDHFKKYQATTGNMIAKRDIRTFSPVATLSPSSEDVLQNARTRSWIMARGPASESNKAVADRSWRQACGDQ